MTTDLHTLSGAYAIDALSAEEAAAFRTHLDACAACCEEVRELRAAAARMGASEALVPPDDLKARVLEAADRTPQLPPKVTPHRGRPVAWLDAQAAAAAAAAVVLVAGAVFGIGQLQGDDSRRRSRPASGQVFEAARRAHRRGEDAARRALRVATSPSKGEMAVDTRDLRAARRGARLPAVGDRRRRARPRSGVLEDQDAGRAHGDARARAPGRDHRRAGRWLASSRPPTRSSRWTPPPV